MLNPNPTRKKDRLSMLRDQMDADTAMKQPAPGLTVPKVPAQPAAVKPNTDPNAGLKSGIGTNPPAQKPGKAPGQGPSVWTDPLGGATRPPPPAPAPPADPSNHDDMYNAEEEFIRSLLEGANNVDTSAEEQFIRDNMDRRMGQGLVDARARGGAAGFAMSGQQLAAEGGVRRDAANDESQQIIDARNKAKQEAIDNALKGIGADTGLLGASEDSAIFDMMMELLGQNPEGDGEGFDGGHSPYDDTDGPNADSDRNGMNDKIDSAAANYPGGEEAFNAAAGEGHTAAASYSVEHHGDFSGLPVGAKTPGSVVAATDPKTGDTVYYDPATKRLFRVRKG